MKQLSPSEKTTPAYMSKFFEENFLNHRQKTYHVKLFVKRSLGILVRIALVFSRRGFDIESLAFNCSEYANTGEVTLVFQGDAEQLKGVLGELKKLVAVESVHYFEKPKFKGIQNGF